MKDKPHGESVIRTAREKFHAYFPLGEEVRGGEKVTALLITLNESFKRDDGLPYFDPALKDPCRLLFGVNGCEIIWNEGKSVLEYLNNCTVLDEIQQSSESCNKSGRFTTEIISKLKIEDVFSGIKFESSGPNQLLGCCPFHDDHKPSLSVNTEKMVWFCHACLKKGNAAQYLMKRDGINAKEAYKELYRLAGVEYQNPEQGDNSVERLLSIARSVEMFQTADEDIVAMIDKNGRISPEKITSEKYKEWLIKQYHNKNGKTPPPTDLNTAIIILKQPDQPLEKKEMFIRVANHGKSLYLDLCNDSGNVVEITENGWKVIQDPPVYFIRKKGMKPLSIERGGSISDLKTLFNLSSENDWKLLVGWILGTFMVEGDYPILAIRGDQASGKSCMTDFIRSIVDPNSNPVKTLPKETRILMINAMNSRILAYDNISRIPSELSDNLSSLATGIGMNTRKMYTDDEEVSFYGARPVILNGIDFFTKDDLADRFISINITRVPDDERMDKSELRKKFNEIKPGVLGAICDTVSSILKNIDNVNLQKKNRMADFETFISAAEKHLGWEPGLFSRVLTENVNHTTEGLIYDDNLSQAVISFMEDLSGNRWSGTATELLKELKEYEDQQNLPPKPNKLSEMLKRRKTNLQSVGIEFSRNRRTLKLFREDYYFDNN